MAGHTVAQPGRNLRGQGSDRIHDVNADLLAASGSRQRCPLRVSPTSWRIPRESKRVGTAYVAAGQLHTTEPWEQTFVT